MRKHSFPGGVHPHEGAGGKALTGALPVKDAPREGTVAIMLSQHAGAPAKPLVNPGDRVYLGQMIGEPGGFVGAPIHASVSGKVRGIETRVAANGLPGEAIVIEDDRLDEWDPSIAPFEGDPFAADPEKLTSRIRAGGVVGLGGAAFPTEVKLKPPAGKTIDTVILNGAECEPYISGDHRTMLENPDAVVDGLLLAMHILSAKRGLIGIERNKPDAIAAVEKAASGKGVTVVPLRTKYPQGGEKQLIQTLTGRQVPSGGLPMDAGCVVINVTTSAAVSKAVRLGRPVIDRVVTMAGLIEKPANLRVRIGTSIGFLIERAGGAQEGANKIVLGGPMMGPAGFSMDTPIVKGTSGILLMKDGTPEGFVPGNCIRCGRCMHACPIRLMPLTLHTLSARELFDEAKKEHAMDCIECGACSYACPAKLPLVHSIRVAKQEIIRKK